MQTGAVYTDPNALAGLKRAAQADSAKAAPEVARQAEALFLGELLKTMRSSSLGQGLLDGPQSEMYRDLLHRQIAVQMSEHGGLGFANSIARAMGGTAASSAAPGSGPTGGAIGLPRGLVGLPPISRMPASSSSASADFESQSAFVTALWPHAQRVGQALGIDGRVILAQAALETGWGERLPTTADGKSSFNLFGIKASGWNGAVARVPTLEYQDGALRRETADFRAYGSYAEAFDDYARFLTENPRYRQALAAGDAAGFAKGLQAAGYATDPAYADKLTGVLGSPLLADLDGVAPSGAQA